MCFRLACVKLRVHGLGGVEEKWVVWGWRVSERCMLRIWEKWCVGSRLCVLEMIGARCIGLCVCLCVCLCPMNQGGVSARAGVYPFVAQLIDRTELVVTTGVCVDLFVCVLDWCMLSSGELCWSERYLCAGNALRRAAVCQV